MPYYNEYRVIFHVSYFLNKNRCSFSFNFSVNLTLFYTTTTKKISANTAISLLLFMVYANFDNTFTLYTARITYNFF